jgi:hypothetical protein
MRRSVLALAALFVTGPFAVAGCGGSGGGTVQSVAGAYFHDLGSGDYAKACTLLTDDLKRQLGDCAGTLRRRHGGLTSEYRDQLRYATVTGVHITGDTAQVTNQNVKVDKTVTDKAGKTTRKKVNSIGVYWATDGKGVTLQKVNGTWRISGGGV